MLVMCVGFIAAAVAALAVFQTAGAAESGQQSLQTIVEKTREREAMFDGFDWRMAVKQSNVGNEQEEIAGDVRYVKSRGRWFAGIEVQSGGPGAGTSAQFAFDGSFSREFTQERGQKPGGRIRKSGDDPGQFIESVLGMRLQSTRASMSEILEGSADSLRKKYPDDSYLSNYDLDVAVKGEEVVAGRKCAVVDCVFKSKDNGETASATRLYFAPELGYACTAVESGGYLGDEWRASQRCEMSDFREVRGGFFFPFELKLASLYNEEGKESVPQDVMEIKTQTFDMPGSFNDTLFTIAFPPGTHVYDEIVGKDYVVGAAASDDVIKGVLERMDGAGDTADAEAVASTGEGTEPATAAVATAAPQEKAAQAEPAAGPISRGRGAVLWGLLAGAVVLVVVILLLRRKRRGGV
jgi:hypothetical protein